MKIMKRVMAREHDELRDERTRIRLTEKVKAAG